MFNPPACSIENSWVLPKVASTYIAIIGKTDNAVMERVNTYMMALVDYWSANNINNFTLFYKDTVADLNEYLASDTYLYPDTGVCFGISVDQVENDFTANLIMNDQQQYGASLGANIPATMAPTTETFTTAPNLNAYDQLSLSGYDFAQNLVANMILQVQSGVDNASINLMNIPLPSENTVTDSFSTILSGLFPLFLILIFMGPIYSTVYGLVLEKQQRSKESMRMMGMTDLPYWLSWFAFYSLQSTVVCLIGWGCLCINVLDNGGSGYIFLYMWLFGEAVFGQVIFYQALFSRAKYSGLVSVLLFFMLEFVNLPIASEGSTGLKGFLSIIPQVAIQQMAVIWADFDQSQIGLDSSASQTVINNYSFSEGLWLLPVGLIFWGTLGLYLDTVLPKEYGNKRHPCFMFFPSTYKGCCSGGNNDVEDEETEERRSTLLKKDHEDGGGMEVRNLEKENYEPVAAEVARSALTGNYLRIENLEKTYDNGF